MEEFPMAMFRWRDRAIFRAPEATLDPDELKLRFRRRTVHGCLLVGILALAYPVLREKRAEFRTDRQARRMSQALLGARARASLTRSPVGVELVEQGAWQVFEYPGSPDCSRSASARLPRDTIVTHDMSWRLLFLESADTSGVGTDISEICFHPAQGILVNAQPLSGGWLYLLVAGGAAAPAIASEPGNSGQVRQLVLTNSGSDLSFQKN